MSQNGISNSGILIGDKFMGINFTKKQAPGATTLLHLRHLPKEKGVGKLFLDAISH